MLLSVSEWRDARFLFEGGDKMGVIGVAQLISYFHNRQTGSG